MPLTIERINDTTFKVTVTDRTTTTHTVTVSPECCQEAQLRNLRGFLEWAEGIEKSFKVRLRVSVKGEG